MGSEISTTEKNRLPTPEQSGYNPSEVMNEMCVKWGFIYMENYTVLSEIGLIDDSVCTAAGAFSDYHPPDSVSKH